MSNRPASTVFAVVLSSSLFLALSGCESEKGGRSAQTEPAVSPAQQYAVTSAIIGAISQATDSGAEIHALAPTPVSQTVNCASGGTANVSGSYEGTGSSTNSGGVVTTAGQYTMNFSMSFDDCQVPGPAGDSTTYSISGSNISIMGDVKYTVTSTANGSTMDSTITASTNVSILGNLSVAGGASTASCNFNIGETLQLTGDATAPAIAGSYTGEACGQALSGKF